ncbi:MAG: hypothetical protein CMG75_04990 [Candidatus Marinimicrobia bacterium]|nr:hypothetical protein [Candidatus Neomarinimicrobiota bacterium]
MSKIFFKRYYAIPILILTITGCSIFTAHGRLEKEGRTAYGNNDFDLAVYKAAQSLAIKSNYKPAQVLIQDAFNAAVLFHEYELKRLRKSKEKFRWDEVALRYKSLVKLNNIIERLPIIRLKSGELVQFNIKDFSSELDSSNQKAAEVHYEEGVMLSNSEDLIGKKRSANEFKLAGTYVAGFRDSEARYEEMRKAAILRIALIIEDKSNQQKFGAINEVVMDNVINSIINDKEATEFLELISRDQLGKILSEQAISQSGIVDENSSIEAGKLLSVHQIVNGKITQIIYSPPENSWKKRKESKKIQVGKEKYTDEDGNQKERKIYETVEAEVKFYKRSTSARITCSYTIVDVETSKILRTDTFEEFSTAYVEWAKFKGDERALSFFTLQLVRKGKQQVPVSGEMVNRAAKKLSSSLATSIKDYAR